MGLSRFVTIQNVGPIFMGLMAGIPYLLATPEVRLAEFPYELLLTANLILLVGAVIFTPRRDKPAWGVILFLEFGVCLTVLVKAVYDSIFIDPQSHSLIPFEFVAAIILTGSGCIVGFIIGWLIRRRRVTMSSRT